MPHFPRPIALLLALATWSTAGSAPAQPVDRTEGPDLEEAVLVTTAGDTLAGEIERVHLTQTPQRIRFRRSPEAPLRSYGPDELQSLRMEDGLRLVRRAVSLHQVPHAPSRAKEYLRTDRPVTTQDTLLLEVLVDGPLTLYTHQGDRDRFYLESDGKIVELIERRWLEETARSEVVLKSSPWYRQQLPGYMQGCPKAQEQIPATERTISSLSALVVKYNRCMTKGRAAPLSTLLDVSVGMQAHAAQRRILNISQRWKQGRGVGLSVEVLETIGGGPQWSVYGSVGVARQSVRLVLETIGQTFLQTTVLGRCFWAERWTVTPYAELGFTTAYSIVTERPAEKFRRDREDLFEMGGVGGLGVRAGPVFAGIRARARTSYLGTRTAVSKMIVAGVQF